MKKKMEMITLSVSKELLAEVQKVLKGEARASYIRRAVVEKLERDAVARASILPQPEQKEA